MEEGLNKELAQIQRHYTKKIAQVKGNSVKEQKLREMYAEMMHNEMMDKRIEYMDEEYEKLIVGRAKGFSTFMSYYILSAIASRDKKLAIELMKEYYGAMLDRGATTFWEDFNIDWLEGSGRIDEVDPTKKDIHGDYGAHCYVGFRHSLCHGWSAGVAKFIKENC
jgi:hypothetical protein